MQLTAVQTPTAFESGWLIPMSTNCPAAIATEPAAEQLCPVLTWHVSAESAIEPGVPTRSVTVIVAPC